MGACLDPKSTFLKVSFCSLGFSKVVADDKRREVEH